MTEKDIKEIGAITAHSCNNRIDFMTLCDLNNRTIDGPNTCYARALDPRFKECPIERDIQKLIDLFESMSSLFGSLPSSVHAINEVHDSMRELQKLRDQLSGDAGERGNDAVNTSAADSIADSLGTAILSYDAEINMAGEENDQEEL